MEFGGHALIFCDIDGVLTRLRDENGNPDPSHFLNHFYDQYGPKQILVDRVITLAMEYDARIIITSNWRRHPEIIDRGDHVLRSPLKKAISMFGILYACTLPPDENVNKAEQMMLFEEDNGRIKVPFVIFDDFDEGFNENFAYSQHFVKIDPRNGITDADLDKARRILSQ